MKKIFQFNQLGGAFIGAAFLMATSAIGPGFITQTTVFTAKMGADFGLVILISILIDIIVQLNIWRAIAAAGLKAPDLANKVLPGAGYILTILVFIGGMVFNIGNVAGCGLGLEAMAGIEPVTGAVLSGAIAIIIFLVKEFGKAMDNFAKWLGVLMIAMVLYVAFSAAPPMAQVIKHSIVPNEISTVAILTLVGGTVGGYISFAGAHRMLDANEKQKADMPSVSKSAVMGIAISGAMRVCLFLAAFGVVSTGFIPDASNPAASIFKEALGNTGERIFGFILWCAAITSVVGASYTSVSFLETWHPFIRRHRQWCIVGFILMATFCFGIFGNPVKILVAAGAINGLVLPFSLALILAACMKAAVIPEYKHPRWLIIAGWLVTALVAWMSWKALTVFFQ